MSAQPRGLPLPLAFALHVLAAWSATPKARARAILYRVASPTLPFIGGWLSPELFFAHTEIASAEPLLKLLASAGYATRSDPPPALSASLASALTSERGMEYVLDPLGLAAFMEALPAVVTHARLPFHPGTKRAVDATALRSLAEAPWTGPISVYRISLRRADSSAMGSALLLVTPAWRAILRAYDPDTLDRAPVQMDASFPVPLVCSRCGATGGHYETVHDQATGARRRRWQETETDEGVVYVCRRCTLAESDGAA